MSSHKEFRMQYLEGNGNKFHIAAERFAIENVFHVRIA